MKNKENFDRNKALMILDWCKNKFGKSEFYKDTVIVKIYKSNGNSNSKDKKEGIRGNYIDGRISLYLGSIRNVKELCATIIHEYKHYLLDLNEYNIILNTLQKQFKNEDIIYNKHPHEKICKRFENKWGIICYNQLKHKLYKQ